MSTVMERLPSKHRITVDELHRMMEVGLIAPDARVELIEGEIIEMPSVGSEHSATVFVFHRQLTAAVGDSALVYVQSGANLGQFSQPVPDLAVVKPRADLYRHAVMKPSDIFLLVEVSDTTLLRDREMKAPLYARHGITEYWIADINAVRLHVFRSPRDGKYSQVSSIDPAADNVTISALPEVIVNLSDAFG